VARITVVAPAALADAAAERLTVLIEQAIGARNRATVALTGGTTPREAYEVLADPSRPWRHRIDWSRLHLYWGDERHVPPDDAESNYGMAARALVQRVPVPPGQVHRMRGELPDPVAAAAEYAGAVPELFDVMLLGLGEDCHIASIFPGSELLSPWREPCEARAREADKRRPTPTGTVAAVQSPTGQWRITLTPPAILNSRAIVMLVAGGNKSAAVAGAIEGALDVTTCPAQLLRDADDRLEWMLDTAAASRLQQYR
jgi:6-phosphogluconolactonase